MDKANWTPEEAVQLARELSNWGTHYRNAVASLYNTFSFELSNYWRGKNYNVVAEYVNEHYDELMDICDTYFKKAFKAAKKDIRVYCDANQLSYNRSIATLEANNCASVDAVYGNINYADLIAAIDISTVNPYSLGVTDAMPERRFILPVPNLFFIIPTAKNNPAATIA